MAPTTNKIICRPQSPARKRNAQASAEAPGDVLAGGGGGGQRVRDGAVLQLTAQHIIIIIYRHVYSVRRASRTPDKQPSKQANRCSPHSFGESVTVSTASSLQLPRLITRFAMSVSHPR
jgi:hypothetical protein